MHDKTSPLFTTLALVVAVSVSVADLLLPPQIETIFFYTVPVLLCARSGHVRLPYLITVIAVVWTIVVTTFEVTAIAQPTSAVIYEALNDLCGVFSVAGLAWFVSARMQRERDLLDVIRFVDTRLQAGDNERVAKMIALMSAGQAEAGRPPAGSPAAPATGGGADGADG